MKLSDAKARWELHGGKGFIWISRPEGLIVTEGIEDTPWHRVVLQVACDTHNATIDTLSNPKPIFVVSDQDDEPVVTWKSESNNTGQTYVWTNGRPFSWPYGKLPDGCIDHGWTSRAEAERLAKTLGFKFEEV